MLRSFVPVPQDSHFPIQNLPYGVFSTAANPSPRLGVAIGEHIVDLAAAADAGLFSGPILSTQAGTHALKQSTLNDFMALGRPAWTEARATLQRLLSADEAVLRDAPPSLRDAVLTPAAAASMHLPAAIGDYTDFYCSREHATNCGTMFRGADAALAPNWLHLPVAYHGRASSIVVSGTDVARPMVQARRTPSQGPSFGPSAVVDFELEMGCFIGPGNALGSPIPIDDAPAHMFGMVLVNDWSARDTQMWEMAPLGPFNSKNWATSISPWVVTCDALEPFKVEAPVQDPPALPYLHPARYARYNYDVTLEATIIPPSDSTTNPNIPPVTRSSLRSLYWTLQQMIAHHTAGGCNLRPGDLIATGTLSREGEGGQGCLLELSRNGTRKVAVGGGERTYLEDGDQVVLRGWCESDQGWRLGFGECRGRLLPARE